MSEYPFGDYILELCRSQNLSLRDASMRAELAPETISQMLRRRGTPRPDSLRLIADNLGGSYQHMMVLAGHLSAPPSDNDVDPILRAKANELIAIWRELREHDPESADRLEKIALLQAEMVLAAARSRDKAERIEQQEEHNPELGEITTPPR